MAENNNHSNGGPRELLLDAVSYDGDLTQINDQYGEVADEQK